MRERGERADRVGQIMKRGSAGESENRMIKLMMKMAIRCRKIRLFMI